MRVQELAVMATIKADIGVCRRLLRHPCVSVSAAASVCVGVCCGIRLGAVARTGRPSVRERPPLRFAAGIAEQTWISTARAVA